MPYAKHLKWGWEEQAVKSLLAHSQDSGLGDSLTNSHSTTGMGKRTAREGGKEESAEPSTG